VHCGAHNGLVKRVGCMRVVHEKLAKQSGQAGEQARRAFDASCEQALQGGKGSYENPLSTGAELRPLLAKAHDDLNPLRIRRLLRAIPDCELQLLDMSAFDGRPENLLIDRLLVPPVAIRPSVDAGPQGSNEDDLTVKLSEILTVNSIIRCALEGGKATVADVANDWVS
jgi:DNA-directed RNA polymerase III subunit RPC1